MSQSVFYASRNFISKSNCELSWNWNLLLVVSFILIWWLCKNECRRQNEMKWNERTNEGTNKIQLSFCKFSCPFILNVCIVYIRETKTSRQMSGTRHLQITHCRCAFLIIISCPLFKAQKSTQIYFVFIVIWCTQFVVAQHTQWYAIH